METEETSELSSPLMTDRVHGGEASRGEVPRLARFWSSVCNDIPAIYAFLATLIRFNNLPPTSGRERRVAARRAVFPFRANGIFWFF